jgi:predicted outer membrane repeat protein
MLEQLEQRDLLSTSPGSVLRPMIVLPNTQPADGPGPAGYDPCQVRTAYGINNMSFPYSGTTPDGSGQTIAIVDAYNDPNIVSDLDTFDQTCYLSLSDQVTGQPSRTLAGRYGAASSFLTVYDEYGDIINPGTEQVVPNAVPVGQASETGHWAAEISLDVEWAHAIAPGAKIDLIECYSAFGDDLNYGVQTAAGLPGVSAVSMSFGGSESSGESAYDSYFVHKGVTFLAATGDHGMPGGYPAYSPNVVAVGGTTLNINTTITVQYPFGPLGGDTYVSETGWSGSGGGISLYEAEPAYQDGVQATTYRTIPDVAFDADPRTGVAICDSFDYGTNTSWHGIGGTSLACPCWAGLLTIINQGRSLEGIPVLNTSSPTEAQTFLYNEVPSADFHNNLGGSNGSSNYGMTNPAIYNTVTGLGSPVADRLLTAGPIVVNNTSGLSSVPGSLPWAVNQANNDTGGKPVVIEFATNPGFTFASAQGITLQSGLFLDHDMNIQAPPAGLNIQGADDGWAVVTVISGTVTLEGLEISGGSGSQQGGGILNDGTLTLSNDLITNDYAVNGGGIYNAAGAVLTMINSTIASCGSAYDGGGIDNAGTARVADSTFTGNDGAGQGGAIYSTGILSVASCNFWANDGGYALNAIDAPSGTVAFTDGTAGVTYAVTSGSVTASGFEGITYGSLLGLALYGTNDVFNVSSTPGPTTFDSGGYCTFNIGSGNLLALQAGVNVYGYSRSDTLVLNDSSATSPHTYAISGNSVTWSGSPGLTYGGLPSLTLDGAAGSTYNVAGTSVPLTLNGTGGNNVYVIGSGGSLSSLPAGVTVQGSGSLDQVKVIDTSGNTGYSYTVTGSSVTQSGLFGGLTYANVGSLLVEGESGGNTTYNILNTSVPTTVSTVLSGGSGTNTFNVGSAADTTGVLTGIQASLTINSGTATSCLNFFDQGQTTGQLYALKGNSLTENGIATITYATIVNVTLNGAAGSTYAVAGTSVPTVLNSGGGNSDFILGDDGNLDELTGPVTVNGRGTGNTIGIDDHASGFQGTYTITADQVGRVPFVWPSGMAAPAAFLRYNDVQSVDLTGSGHADAFDVLSTSSALILYGVGGNDTFTIGSGDLANLQGPVWVYDFGGGINAVTVNDQNAPAGQTYTVGLTSVMRNGLAAINFSQIDTLVLNAGNQITGGNNTFVVQALPAATVTLNGGSGINTLDYSQYVGNVMVDLPLGVATGFSGGISNIRNVTGSQGNDLLVGDANPNVLIGGTGRNVMIGGAGADTLDGSRATSDNLLIGGTTNYDANLAALNAVFAEWTRTDLSFAYRVTDLATGKNGAGKTPLNVVGGKPVLLTPSTVHGNGAAGKLIGTQKTDPATKQRAHNWFFYDAADVLINFLGTSDRKTKVV